MQAGICFLVSIEWWSSPARLITSIIAGWRDLASGRAWWSLAPLAVARFGVVGPERIVCSPGDISRDKDPYRGACRRSWRPPTLPQSAPPDGRFPEKRRWQSRCFLPVARGQRKWKPCWDE